MDEELLFTAILQEVGMMQLQTQDMVSMVGALMDSILLTLHYNIHPQDLVFIPLKIQIPGSSDYMPPERRNAYAEAYVTLDKTHRKERPEGRHHYRK